MSIFCTATLCVMILLLVGAFLLLLAKARQYPNPWLLGFLGSLIVSAAWGFLGPICYGLKAYDILNVGDILNRVTGLLGYVALFVYALALVRKE